MAVTRKSAPRCWSPDALLLPEGGRTSLIASATFCGFAPATPHARFSPKASSARMAPSAQHILGRKPAKRCRQPARHQVSRRTWLSHGRLSLKSRGEFAGPGAPQFDFVVTACDSAAGEACPKWPSHPAMAHWGIGDPVAEGSDIEKEQASVRWRSISREESCYFSICLSPRSTRSRLRLAFARLAVRRARSGTRPPPRRVTGSGAGSDRSWTT